MSEHLPDEFDEFVQDCGEARAEPASLEDIKRRYPKTPTPSELLAVGNREREQKSEASDFERLILAEEAVAQQRIEGVLKEPGEFHKATEPRFEGEAAPAEGDLSWAVGGVETDEPPPSITATRANSGRAPGSSFAKSHGSTRGSILDRPFDELMELVGERASTPGARSLAQSLAQQSREIGGGL